MSTAQIVTTSWTELGDGILKWSVSWISASDGSVVQTLSGLDLGKVLGWYCFCVKVNPGATTPSASWDWTFTDEDGIDVMGGLGTDMSNSASVLLLPKLDGTNYRDVVVDGAMTLTIAAAGDAKNGVISFFFRKTAGQ